MFICLKKITFFSSQTTNNWRFLRIFVIEKTKCYIYEEEISSKHYRRRDDVSFLTPNSIIGTTLFLPIFRLKLFFNGYLQKDSYSFFIRMIIRFKLSETSLADSGFQTLLIYGNIALLYSFPLQVGSAKGTEIWSFIV